MNERDKLRVEAVRNASIDQLADFSPDFQDERLPSLLLHYKARSFPTSLNESEMVQWEQWRSERLKSQLPAFVAALQRNATSTADEEKQFLLQELQLWAESIVPSEY